MYGNVVFGRANGHALLTSHDCSIKLTQQDAAFDHIVLYNCGKASQFQSRCQIECYFQASERRLSLAESLIDYPESI